MSDILEQELKTFATRREELLGSSEGKFVLVHDEEVVGPYESQMDAIAEGYRRFGNVPFLVKEVTQVERPIDFLHRYTHA